MLRPEHPNKNTDCTSPFFFGDACCVRKERLMYSVGIDWADQKHNVCILAPDRRILSEFTVNIIGVDLSSYALFCQNSKTSKSTWNDPMVCWSIGWSVRTGRCL